MTPNWKPARGTAKAARKARRRANIHAERLAKATVRKRDGRCRFPLCQCHKLRLPLEASHQKHKGMGGNPTGDRSTSAGMVLLCRPRHRGWFRSVDAGAIWWEALTPDGADGPIRWWGDPRELAYVAHLLPPGVTEMLLATESEPGKCVVEGKLAEMCLHALGRSLLE
jgi:hypothetical protein